MKTLVPLALLLLMTLTPAAEEAGDIYFKSGAEKYFSGDTEGALKDLEAGYLFDQLNAKLASFYVKVLVERASALYQEKRLPEALSLINRAREVLPGDAKVRELTRIISQEAGGARTPEAGRSGARSAGGGGRSAEVSALALEIARQQEKLVEAYVAPIRDLIEKNARNQERFINRTFLFSVIGVVLGILVTVSLMYVILHYVSVRREALLMAHQERIVVKLLAQNAAANQTPFFSLPGTPQEGLQRVLTDERPQNRSMNVDIIEAEIVEDTGREMAQRLLVPFLHDGDNRVRAKAARAMFRFDRRLSLDTLRDMTRSDDRWMRVSAAWALSELLDEEAAGILLQMAGETEPHVKRMVLKGLQRMARNDEGRISAAVREGLVRALDDIRKKEGWIV